MPVLVEAISVIIKTKRIRESFPGGWDGFVSDCPNDTLCSDGELARLGFMEQKDVEACVRGLESVGFVYMDSGACVDVVVVDQQQGPTTRCDWIEFGKMRVGQGDVSICRQAGSTAETFVTPDGWTYENSLSHRFTYESTDDGRNR